MRYLGGKERIAAHMAPLILAEAKGRPIWEPFCGGLSVSAALARAGAGRLYLSDANRALISLYQAWDLGWRPPVVLGEADHAAAKGLPDSDPIKAFLLVGCSFVGQYGSGWAREGRRDFARGAANSLDRKFQGLARAAHDFAALDFMAEAPEGGLPVYCDPPYAGTTGYRGPGVPAWDPAAFWARAREWAAAGSTVLVSEYQAPPDATCIWARERDHPMGRGLDRRRVERIYRLGP